jgi:hypothetical protein
MKAYNKLLAQQNASDASALRQTANDRVLGQFEAWLKAKPQELAEAHRSCLRQHRAEAPDAR